MGLKQVEYNRGLATDYAKKWAVGRNPRYYDFDKIGGDCTNFISQCVFSGVGVMNYTPVLGWYYNSVKDRAPSWTSVDGFYKFLITNEKTGPYAQVCSIEDTQVGDVIQLATMHDYFHHTLIIVEKNSPSDLSQIKICAHTYDAYFRPLSTYNIKKIRCIKIKGARKY